MMRYCEKHQLRPIVKVGHFGETPPESVPGILACRAPIEDQIGLNNRLSEVDCAMAYDLVSADAK